MGNGGRAGVCLWQLGMVLVVNTMWSQSDEPWNANGTLENWWWDGSGWHLNASEPGQAWLYTCPTLVGNELGDSGRHIRWKWTQAFSGSTNNFSRLHFFSLPAGADSLEVTLPIAEWSNDQGLDFPPGSFIHLGQTGSTDALEWHQSAGSLNPDASFEWMGEALPGEFAQGMETWFEWHQSDSLTTVYFQPVDALTPIQPLFTGNHFAPDCIGISAQFTSSNTQNIRFELSHFGPFIPDTMPPKLLGYQFISDSSFSLHFNEPIASGFGVWPSGDTTLMQVSDEASHIAIAPVDTTWMPGTAQWLSLHQFYDTLNNVLADTSFLLIHTSPQLGDYHDVVLTEIMVDPTPSQGLPDCEWAEILNRSTLWFDIQQWHWWDESSSSLCSMEPRGSWDGMLAPGSRAILSTCNEPITANHPQEALIVENSSFLDAGDALGLLRMDGIPLDIVRYDQSWWPGENGGISLQILDPGACSGPSNWTGSTSSTGSTPGVQSEQELIDVAQAEPLEITSVVPTSNLTGFLDFNEAIDSHSLVHTTPPSWGFFQMDVLNSRRLHYTRQISSHRDTIDFEIHGVKGCHSSMNASEVKSHHVQIVQHGFPISQQLVITEISASPAGSTLPWGEFVEICNRTDSLKLELGGLICGQHIIQDRIVLGPKERHIMYPGSLPQKGGEILIVSALGEILDEVRYSKCWHHTKELEASGCSLIRMDLQGPSNDGENWRSSSHPSGASPGESDPAESVFTETAPVQIMLCGTFHDEWVVLLSSTATLLEENWREVGLSSEEHWAQDWDRKHLWATPQALPFPDSIRLQASNDTIYTIGTHQICTSSRAPTGGFILNEIRGNWNPQNEPFVEIIHHSMGDLGTTNWFISSEDLPFPVDWRPLSEDVDWAIAPGEPWAFAACPNRLFNERAIPADLPSLYGDRWIQLVDLTEMAVETYALSKNNHAPWVSSTAPVSLERVSAHTSSSWKSCVHVSGATPGDENSWSRFQPMDSAAELPQLKIHNDTWHPSGSGADSFHNGITFSVIPSNEGTFQLHLEIIDSQGRVIFDFQNEPQMIAPGNPTWTDAWDGRTLRGYYAPPGPYLFRALFVNQETKSRYFQARPIHVAPWNR